MTARRWLLFLLLIGLVLRIGLWAAYGPTEAPDTGTYVAAAEDLLAGDLSRSEGRRTPGYPLLIAIAGFEPVNVWVLQMLAGLLVSALIFYIALEMTGRPAIAFAAGLTYSINLAQLFFEAALLSETATTLSVVAVVAAMINVFHRLRDGRPVTGSVLLLGFLGGVATLTRPQFVFLPLLLPALVALASKRYVLGTRLALTNSMLIAVPGLLIILVWCAWVYAQTGYFTLSTQSGLGLTNHSIGFVELAPERYAGVRDVLLKHREAKIATKGHSRDTIWDAMPELKQVTGLSLPQISSEVQRMSLELFTRHPLRYGVSVGKGWIGFWLVPNPWEPDRLRPGWLGPVLEALWWLEHKVLRLVNAIFVLFLLAVAAWAPARRAAGWDLDMTAISAVIIASSMIQALAEYGANSRYGVPTQALVVLVVLVALHRYCISRLARQGRVPKGQIG